MRKPKRITRKVSQSRWAFAQGEERRYQELKRAALVGREDELCDRIRHESTAVAASLASLGYPPTTGLVAEIGSGAHGLIWGWPYGRRIAIDPLATFYRRHFAFLQANGPSIIDGCGESIPLSDGSVTLLLSDNVLDHGSDPQRFLEECRRVLAPDGAFYLTIDVHHRVWSILGTMYNALHRIGLRLRVPAFPHHPYHLREQQVERMVDAAGFAVVRKTGGEELGAARESSRSGRRITTSIKRVFFKNARLEIVAVPRR